MLRGLALGGLMLLGTTALVDLASAAECGDTSGPGGTKVRCACGDMVTTNAALNAVDPVITSTCPGDGLIVMAGIRLNLNGQTIKGSGLGIGTGVIMAGDAVRVIAGGTSSSSIRGFENGVIGNTSNGQITGISISENIDAGVDIAGNLNRIETLQVFSNGGNGITVVGDANTISRSTTSSNGGDGINLEGDGNTISTNQAFSNGDDGIDVVGDNNTLDTNSAGDAGKGNANAGIRVEGSVVPALPIGQAFNNNLSDNRAYANGTEGIIVIGGKNRITSSRAGDGGKGNGGNGIRVEGNLNLIDDHNGVFANRLNGIVVIGDANTLEVNTIGDKAKGNGGAGIQVSGASNRLAENKVYANLGDGIDVSRGTATSPNLLIKNTVGDRTKGNGGNGIFIHDDIGNGKPNPVELDSNIVRSNTLDGIRIDTGGHELKKNSSGGSGDQRNGGCEFRVVGGNFNATGNTANGKTVTPNTDGAAFPPACLE